MNFCPKSRLDLTLCYFFTRVILVSYFPTDATVKSAEGLAVDVVLKVSRVEVIGEIEDFHSNSRTFMV